MQSEEHWKTLIAGVEQCQQLGMVVWLYDEDGYPSGAAGGLVLAENPALRGDQPGFRRVPAGLSVPAARLRAHPRQQQLLRGAAMSQPDRRPGDRLLHREDARGLLEAAGALFRRHDPGHVHRRAVADGGQPGPVARRGPQERAGGRSGRPVGQAVAGRALVLRSGRAIPASDTARICLPQRRSLFVGDSAEDRKVRRQYWALVADLIADRYFGAIGRWCADHRVASSGHSLWEEQPMHHVPLEGNGLKVLARMDIPGLDMLSSDPKAVCYGGWMTAAMPASAALLTGRRRVMTEVSDFSQKMGGQGPAGLAEMQATAAWQAAWGVTDFTLYYGIADRSADDYRAYCEYVGRLNAVLKPAQPDPEVLLYYPIHDLWAEYLPVAEPLSMPSQSPRAQRIVGSFQQIGQLLGRRQIPFAVIDHEFLAAAKVRPEGTLAIGNCSARVLILPQDVELPQPAGDVVEAFRRAGGRVLSPSSLGDLMRAACRVEPPSEDIVLGRFLRDGRRVMLLVNVGTKPYAGHLTTVEKGTWQMMDPATGAIRPAATDQDARIPLELNARQAILLVEGLPDREEDE